MLLLGNAIPTFAGRFSVTAILFTPPPASTPPSGPGLVPMALLYPPTHLCMIIRCSGRIAPYSRSVPRIAPKYRPTVPCYSRSTRSKHGEIKPFLQHSCLYLGIVRRHGVTWGRNVHRPGTNAPAISYGLSGTGLLMAGAVVLQLA
eukprot:69312-Rhodomonas_salina.7